MKRKEFVKKSVIGTLGVSGLISACAQNSTENKNININTNKTFEWRMVTTWPPNFPVLGEAPLMLAEWVNKMSNGRLNIKVYGSGELVPGLESFDAVTSGTAEMASGAAYYWTGKLISSQFFCSIPFGMNAQQVQSWLISGGGYELWKEAYAKFNLIPFLGGNSGVQMGGWFNKEINSVDDLKGLKMRIPGLGGMVLNKHGGSAVTVAGGEIYNNLEQGVIDATEWIGPYHDYKMGFYKIAKYYYTPGWHEPGPEFEFFVNKSKFEELSDDLKEILACATYRANTWIISEFEAKNSFYLDKLIKEHNVNLKNFPEQVLKTLRKTTQSVVNEIVETDEFTKKVYESYKSFLDKNKPWVKISEKAYYNSILDV